MPGNEVGDRVHNFFGQQNLYHGQQQLQAADGTRPMLTNDTWAGNQRQFAASFTSNFKHYSALQTANSEVREYGNVLSHMADGFSNAQPNLGSELDRSQAYNQQKTLNGFVQGNHMLGTRQNEANILVGGVASDRKSLSARDLTFQEASSLDVLEDSSKNLMELETNDAPVSFDLFGGQKQINGGHLNMMHSLQRQQLRMPDSKLIQQQAILSQLQRFQRQQQVQFEARDHSSMNHVSSIMRQDTGNDSPFLSSKVPVNEVPNHSRQLENVEVNVNWAHYGSSPVVHGSSSGLMSTSEHNHAVGMMGLIPRQIDQSPYGVHIPTARSNSRLSSPTQMDKLTYHQLSNINNSFPLNKHTAFPYQSDMQNETSIMEQNFHGKSFSGQTADLGLNVLNSENLNSGNSQRGNASVQDSHSKQRIAKQSESLDGKTEMTVSSSQYVATLDPTEEKFLYGSDDSLWDAFGRITTFGSGGSNMLDGVLFDSGFSSMQTGTWSALMQSAVAETLSSTSGLHDEWSGPSSWNAESPNESQPLASVIPVWVGNNFQTTSMQKSESCSAPVDASRCRTINYCDASRFQQQGTKSSTEQGESLHPYSSQVPYFLQEESRCLDQSELQKPFGEGLRISENVNHLSGVEIKANNILSSWTSGKRTPLLKNVSQHGKQNGPNFIGSVSSVGNGNLKYHENQNLLPNPQGWDHKRAIPEEKSHAAVMFKNDFASHSCDEVSDTKCAIEPTLLPQCYDEGDRINGDPARPLSNTLSANRGSMQQYLGPLDTEKDVDCSVIDKSPVAESLRKSGLNKRASEILEMKEANRKETFSHCFHSSISNHKDIGGLVEHLQSDVDEGWRLPVSKQKSTSNVGRKPSSTRKFQYHPMGDLEVDAEPFNENKYAKHSPAMAQDQFHGHGSPEFGSIEQSKFGQVDKNSLEVDKGNGTTSCFGEIPSHKMLSQRAPDKADSFDNFIGNNASPNFPTSSQNMLELLHKVDRHREHGTTTNFSPLKFNPSQMDGGKNYGLIDQTHQFQSSASHGFGLQLGPPSQQLSKLDTALSSHKSLEVVQISARSTSEIKGKMNSWLAPATSTKPFISSLTPLEGDHKYHTCPSESLDSGGSLQAEHKRTNQCPRPADDFCNRIETSHSGSAPDISGNVPQPKVDAPHVQNPAQESDWLTTSQQVEFSKVSSNEWGSVTAPQQPSQPLKSSHLLQCFQSDNNLERNFSRPKVLNQISEDLVNSSSGIHSINLQSFVGRKQPMKDNPTEQVSPVDSGTPLQLLSTLQGNESLGLHDSASAKPATTDCETFGYSPSPINTGDQHLSSLHQVDGINRKNDLRVISEKRFKSRDRVTDFPEVVSSSELNDIIEVGSIDHASLSSGDSKIPTLLSQPGDSPNVNGLSLDGSVPFQGNAPNLSISNNISCDGGEHSGISPQMAPSWFDRYGSFKNGHMFTVPGPTDSTINLMTQSLPFGKTSECLSSQHSLDQPNSLVDNSVLDSTPKSSPLPLKEFGPSACDLLSSVVGNQSLGVQSHKRKTSTSELLPWHEELALGSQRLQNISLADVEWSQATNRLIEMREDEAEMIDDIQLFRPKKRQTLTSKLMQQLLRPPPATFLSADASLQYASVVYLVARFASSDACSAISTTGIETVSPSDCKNHFSGKIKRSAKIGDQLHKLMEDCIGRAKKLENDFLRMGKGVSIPDLRVGCQDLEKFSIINRFAKFHIRGQVDGREASSSDVTANSLRICPQRYVTAVPMPRNLPDGSVLHFLERHVVPTWNHASEKVGEEWSQDGIQVLAVGLRKQRGEQDPKFYA